MSMDSYNSSTSRVKGGEGGGIFVASLVSAALLRSPPCDVSIAETQRVLNGVGFAAVLPGGWSPSGVFTGIKLAAVTLPPHPLFICTTLVHPLHGGTAPSITMSIELVLFLSHSLPLYHPFISLHPPRRTPFSPAGIDITKRVGPCDSYTSGVMYLILNSLI